MITVSPLNVLYGVYVTHMMSTVTGEECQQPVPAAVAVGVLTGPQQTKTVSANTEAFFMTNLAAFFPCSKQKDIILNVAWPPNLIKRF